MRDRLIRPGEGSLVATCGLFAFLAVALAILLRTWSDAAFLSAFDVDRLPIFFIASAVVFVPATFGYAWLVRQAPPAPLNTALMVLFASGALGASTWQPAGGKGLFGVVLLFAVVSPLVNVICWNSILDRLDSRQGKRLIPVIGGMSTLGAILAGVGAGELSARHGADSLLWACVALLTLMAPLPALITSGVTGPGGSGEHKAPTDSFQQGLAALGRNRLLVMTAATVFLMAIATNVVDFVFKARLQEAYDKDAMGVFLGRFHGATNLAVLAVQFFIVPRALKRMGVALAAAVHPAVVLLGAGATLAFPGLLGAVALRFGDTLLKFTFGADTHQMLLTAAPPDDRRQAKVLIKGVVYPLGGLAAGIVLAAVSPAHAPAMAGCFAGAWLLLTLRLHQHYTHEVGARLEIEVGPPSGEHDPSGDEFVARWVLRERLEEVEKLRQIPSDERTRSIHDAQMHDALDGVFRSLGELVGDEVAVGEAAKRYLHGGPVDRARAVELLDSMIHHHAHGLSEAAEVLERVSADRSKSARLHAQGSKRRAG